MTLRSRIKHLWGRLASLSKFEAHWIPRALLLDQLDLTDLEVFEGDFRACLGVKVLAMVPVDFASFCLKFNSGEIVGAFKFMKF